MEKKLELVIDVMDLQNCDDLFSNNCNCGIDGDDNDCYGTRI